MILEGLAKLREELLTKLQEHCVREREDESFSFQPCESDVELQGLFQRLQEEGGFKKKLVCWVHLQ